MAFPIALIDAKVGAVMRSILFTAAVLLAAPACKGKDDKAASSTKEGTAVTAEKPAPTCKPGELISGDACVAVVTADTVAAVQAQGDRIDQLAKVLDDVATYAAPIELLNAFRQLEAWKQIVTLVPELEKVEGVVATLDEGTKQLAAFRASLGDVRTRLGNIQTDVKAIYETSGTKQKVDEVRAKISAEVKAAVATLDAATQQVVAQAITPALAQLGDVSDIVDGACALAKLKGGGAELQKLCEQAKGVFGPAKTYLEGLRTQPTALLKDVADGLEKQLDALLDQAAKAALDEAQAHVDAALKAP